MLLIQNYHMREIDVEMAIFFKIIMYAKSMLRWRSTSVQMVLLTSMNSA